MMSHKQDESSSEDLTLTTVQVGDCDVIILLCILDKIEIIYRDLSIPLRRWTVKMIHWICHRPRNRLAGNRIGLSSTAIIS